MPIEVTGPGGKVETFPDGTPREEIERQLTAKWGAGGMQPHPGLQQPGTNTVAAGALTPNLQTAPGRMDPETWRTLALSQLFPHAGALLQHTPGMTYQTELAKKSAETLAKTEEAQRAGLQTLASYAKLVHEAQKMPDDVYKRATGQYAMKPFKEYLPLVGGMTAPAAGAAYLPNILGGASSTEASDAQTLLGHLVHGVNAASDKSSTTDAQRATINHAMQDFMMAGNRETAMKILSDAGLMLANNANIPQDIAQRIVRAHLQEYAQADAHKSLLRAAGNVPPDAIKDLLANRDNPIYVQSFNKNFYGNRPGLAESILDAHPKPPSANVKMPNPEAVALPKTPDAFPMQGLE